MSWVHLRLTWFCLCVIILDFDACNAFAAHPIEKVEYVTDSIAEKEGKYIRLLGGSSWILSSPSIALVTDEIIIVFREIELSNKRRVKVAVAYLDGDEILVRHVGGRYIAQTGYLTTVVKAIGRGAVLQLANGSFLAVPEYDQFDTGWWLPPYQALLTRNMLYLYNLKKGKRVWVRPAN